MSRPAAADDRDPFAVFRPRRGRLVSSVVGVVALLVFTVGAVSLPARDAIFGDWGPIDRAMVIGCGGAVALLMWRYATIRAVPTRERLVVRNLVTTRELEWAHVVRVQFGGGAPWVTLELSDTDTVAVMAIQKADGPFGRAEAARLSALVQALSSGRPGAS